MMLLDGHDFDMQNELTNNAPCQVNFDSLLNHQLQVTKLSKHARIIIRYLASDDHEKCLNYHKFMETSIPKLRILE